MPEKVPLEDAAAKSVCAALTLEGFFEDGFTAADAQELFPGGALFHYDGGEQVLREGEPGKDVFVLCSGRLAVTQFSAGMSRLLNQILPGHLFGEIGLLKDGLRSAGVVAEEVSLVFRIPRLDLQRILEAHSPLGEHLLALSKTRK
ncbi:MAG TPA: cyclic nucleotide-binding domain-containing protein [Elusimicrobiota bacterium]|nr:cyclic nucleotide-binding domain-containing protein [Elusimicrobiota bacterium]